MENWLNSKSTYSVIPLFSIPRFVVSHIVYMHSPHAFTMKGFDIYIHTLKNISTCLIGFTVYLTPCSSIKFFADDVAMYCSVHSTGDCDAFQQDLDSIAVWCSKWQMRLNVSKCDLLCISNKRTPIKPSYHINNYNLHWVSYVKYLGVFVDSKLSWNYHVSHVSAKVAKVLNLLRRHMYTCQSSFKHKAFRALVLLILDYASVVWNPHTHKNVSTLEKIQNRGARWVCGSRFNPQTLKWSKSSVDCCRECHWPSLSTRRKYLCLTTLYVIFHQLISLSFDNYFTLSSTETRSHSFSLLCKQSSDWSNENYKHMHANITTYITQTNSSTNVSNLLYTCS